MPLPPERASPSLPNRPHVLQNGQIRSDVYSLGATLYAVLTGRPPLEGLSPAETILKIETEEPVKPTKYHLSIPPLFEDIVLRMLAKRPEDRPQTAAKLLKELYQVAKYQGLRFDDPKERKS